MAVATVEETVVRSAIVTGGVYRVNVKAGPANTQVEPGEYWVQALGCQGDVWRGFVSKDGEPRSHGHPPNGIFRYCSFTVEDLAPNGHKDMTI